VRVNLSDRLDRFQRSHRVLGVPIAIAYKFFDDQGNYLSAMITYYAFIAIFPLLLIGSSVLGFVLQGNDSLRDDILNSTLRQFPIIGDQLGRPEGLRGSVTAVVVGAAAALYGALGLGQAIQNAMNIAWAVPRNSRPNPFLLRLRSLFLLVTAGFALLAVSLVSVIGSNAEVFSARIDTTLRWLINLITVAVIALMLTMLFRLAAAHRHDFRAALPGALFVAIMWQSLQLAGSVYVKNVIGRTSAMNATFALVLGLIALIFIAAAMALIGIEINVVLCKGLYPRALLTPFTDNVDLTEADRRAYVEYAQAQRHKGFERVQVIFDERRREAAAAEYEAGDAPLPPGAAADSDVRTP